MNSSLENKKQNIEELTKQAIQLKQNGQIDKAIQLIRSAIELDTTFYRSYYHLGDFLLSDRKLPQAEEAYRKVIQLNPEFSWTYHGLSLIYSLQGDLDESVRLSRKAIALKSDVKGFYRRLGQTLAKKGELDESVKAYEKAIALDPELAIAHNELGDLLYQQKKFALALDTYQTALELGCKSHDMYANMGNIYLQREEWVESADFYSQAIALQPDFPWDYYNLGQSLQKQGQFAQAISNYAKALQIDPGFAPAYHKLMFSKLQPQQLNEVVGAFRHNIQQQPGASWLYTRLGDLLSKQGQIPEAVKAYNQATYKLNLWLKPEYTKEHWEEGKPEGPNFIIVGAMKAGTTSLYEYINQHPQVLPCAQKEVHFFVHHLEKGLDWYLAHFPHIPPTGGYLTGEASPGYLCNTVQSKVKETFPEVKLIAVLRNPVERAISHYYHNVKHGIEMRSFEAAMTAEMKAIASLPGINLVKETKNWSGEQGYLFTGLYVYFLQKWISAFERQQILIVKSEDLYQKSKETMDDVFDFLELPRFASEKYVNHLPGAYQKLANNDAKYQLIANFFDVYNQRLADYLQQPFAWH